MDDLLGWGDQSWVRPGDCALRRKFWEQFAAYARRAQRKIQDFRLNAAFVAVQQLYCGAATRILMIAHTQGEV
jgi:hypothetical protein